jgi:ATP-dependent Clp endopeptidase proteolytic subunit ClpP
MIKIEIDPKIKIKKLEEIIDLPVVITVNEFNEKSALKFREDFSRAINTGQKIIPLVLDTWGGEVYSLMNMMSIIKSSTIPVATIGVSKSMSCGSVLLSCGAEGHRYCDQFSTVMLHDVSTGYRGKIEDIKASAAEGNRLNEFIFKQMAVNVGKEPEYFLKLIHEAGHADIFWSAEECKKHNLINHIRAPNFKVKLSSEITFE